MQSISIHTAMSLKSTNFTTQPGTVYDVLRQTHNLPIDNDPIAPILEIDWKPIATENAPVAKLTSDTLRLLVSRKSMNRRSASIRYAKKKASSMGTTLAPSIRARDVGALSTEIQEKANEIVLPDTISPMPSALPPLESGTANANSGLGGAVSQMEVEIQVLKLQLEMFKKAHDKLEHDYESLEARCKRLESLTKPESDKRDAVIGLQSSVKRNNRSQTPVRTITKNNLNTVDRDEDLTSNERNMFPERERGERPPTQIRILRVPSTTLGSSQINAEGCRKMTETRGLPARFCEQPTSRNLANQGSPKGRFPNGNSSPRVSIPCNPHLHLLGAGEQSDGNSSPTNSHPTPDGQSRPRAPHRRVTSITMSKPREFLGSVGIGADFEAFPRWSKLGLHTMETFKSAQGPSAVRRWKNRKLPTVER